MKKLGLLAKLAGAFIVGLVVGIGSICWLWFEFGNTTFTLSRNLQSQTSALASMKENNLEEAKSILEAAVNANLLQLDLYTSDGPISNRDQKEAKLALCKTARYRKTYPYQFGAKFLDDAIAEILNKDQSLACLNPCAYQASLAHADKSADFACGR